MDTKGFRSLSAATSPFERHAATVEQAARELARAVRGQELSELQAELRGLAHRAAVIFGESGREAVMWAAGRLSGAKDDASPGGGT